MTDRGRGPVALHQPGPQVYMTPHRLGGKNRLWVNISAWVYMCDLRGPEKQIFLHNVSFMTVLSPLLFHCVGPSIYFRKPFS